MSSYFLKLRSFSLAIEFFQEYRKSLFVRVKVFLYISIRVYLYIKYTVLVKCMSWTTSIPFYTDLHYMQLKKYWIGYDVPFRQSLAWNINKGIFRRSRKCFWNNAYKICLSKNCLQIKRFLLHVKQHSLVNIPWSIKCMARKDIYWMNLFAFFLCQTTIAWTIFFIIISTVNVFFFISCTISLEATSLGSFFCLSLYSWRLIIGNKYSCSWKRGYLRNKLSGLYVSHWIATNLFIPAPNCCAITCYYISGWVI